ncbi:hypothetical protein C0992_004597 [Termitomyces sp. T32_za158]|nr:hypothetical protein C0992_004597 [Termitomyces sp. T32_za158]
MKRMSTDKKFYPMSMVMAGIQLISKASDKRWLDNLASLGHLLQEALGSLDPSSALGPDSWYALSLA